MPSDDIIGNKMAFTVDEARAPLRDSHREIQTDKCDCTTMP